MTHKNIKQIFTDTKFKAVAWIFPVILIGLFAVFVLMPLRQKIADTQTIVALKSRNVYEKSWLDSVEARLKSDMRSLQTHKKAVHNRLCSSYSIQKLSDEIRQLFTKSGIDVHTVKSSVKNGTPYKTITIKVEGTGHYAQLFSLLKTVRRFHPQYAVESMAVRRSRGNIFISVPVTIYVRSDVVPHSNSSHKHAAPGRQS